MSEEIRIPEPKSSRFGFLKSKVFWMAAVLIGGGAIWLAYARSANQGPMYETAAVERGDVVQTVEVTGEIVPEARLALAFKSGGAVENIATRVGQRVAKGTLLAELESRDLRFSAERAYASLAIAQANLNAKLAGATKESIAIAAASVDQARAAYEKSLVDLEVTKRSVRDEYEKAQLALTLAEQNRENSSATAEQTVVTDFETLRAALQTALGPMRNGLVDGDAVIGIDNAPANDDYETVLGIAASADLTEAKRLYPQTKTLVNQADQLVRALNSASSRDSILNAAAVTQDALKAVQLYLTYVQKTLAGTGTTVSFTRDDLDALQASIGTDITSIGTQLSTVVSDYETARNADLTKQTTIDQLENAYQTAAVNLRIAESERETKVDVAESNAAIQLAALESAEATLAERKAPPREVDVAALRAQVIDAQTAYNQAREKLADVQIVAPADGIITEIIPNRGEVIAANQAAVRMITTDGYTVEALVPEADIVKVEPGQSIDITLDAYGENESFTGTVIAENADQTVVQEAIYYKIYVDVEADERDVKPGMTANLTILTGERNDVLVIPSRSLRVSEGGVSVRVLENGEAKERSIDIGLRGDEGRVEVVSGLEEGEQVVTGELGTQ